MVTISKAAPRVLHGTPSAAPPSAPSPQAGAASKPAAEPSRPLQKADAYSGAGGTVLTPADKWGLYDSETKMKRGRADHLESLVANAKALSRNAVDVGVAAAVAPFKSAALLVATLATGVERPILDPMRQAGLGLAGTVKDSVDLVVHGAALAWTTLR